LLGLQTAAEFKVPGSDPNHGQRDVTALQTRDGRIWVFSSTGFGPGDNHIYCFTYYRGTWQGPTAISIQEDKWIGHINALEYQGKIWLFYDAEYSLKSAYYDGTWHGPYNIATEATLGKAIVDNGKFYIAWAYVDPVQNIWGSYIGLSSSTNGKNWVNHGPIASWPEPEATNWDPVLIKDRCYFKLIWAPDAGTKGQFIATSKSTNPTDPTSWSTPTKLTVASHGTENWWDFWPQPIRMGNGALNSIFLVYASERSKDGTNRIDSNIWLRMTLDL
jgi:hypothetical protein